MEVPDDTAISFEDFDQMFHVKHFPELLQQWNLNITDEQEKLLYLFYQNLTQWNKVMNLTAITEPGDVLVKHYLDSFSLVTVFPLEQLEKGIRIMDVGTGAGFPGALLAIVSPEKEFTLLDSTLKRLRVIDEFAQTLNINNLKTVHARAEEISRKPEYNEAFDICVSRAVANLEKLSGWCLPFVRKGGSFIAYKGENYEEELQQAAKVLKKNKAHLSYVESYKDMPEEISGHVLLIISK